MASQPTQKIDIDYFFRAEEARTPPQLRASNPLDDSRSQSAVASEEEVMGQMAGGKVAVRDDADEDEAEPLVPC